jgi:hypothetical protein
MTAAQLRTHTGAWTRCPTRRCPSGPGRRAATRPPTSRGSWRRTSNSTRPARARCCAARAVHLAALLVAQATRQGRASGVAAAPRPPTGRPTGPRVGPAGAGERPAARPGRPAGQGGRGPGGTLRAAWQARDQQRRPGRRGPGGGGGRADQQLMATLEQAVATLAPAVGTVRACRAVGQPRAGGDRRHRQSPSPPRPPRPPRPTPAPRPRALSAAERQQVLDLLHEERFCDLAPASVWATLLDEGTYLASVSTTYRLLRAQGETGDRRRPATHPARVKPELLAGGPNQCWSGDITRLAGPAKGDLGLPVHDLGHLRPLCGRLDGRCPGGRPAGRAAAGRHHHHPAGGGGHAHHPCPPSMPTGAAR